LLLLIAIAGVALAADRPVLNGTWQLNANRDGKLKFETVSIQQTEDSIKISETSTKEKPADLACQVDGRECKLKEGLVSFWYNGSELVMMEMHHNRDLVTKTELTVSDDGKTLTLQVTRVAPPGTAVTYTFTKQP
jgi:hypothetical protein